MVLRQSLEPGRALRVLAHRWVVMSEALGVVLLLREGHLQSLRRLLRVQEAAGGQAGQRVRVWMGVLGVVVVVMVGVVVV